MCGMQKTLRWLLLIFLLVYVANAVGSYTDQNIKIKNKDGVTIVKNPDTPVDLPGLPRKVKFTHELTIGENTEDEKKMIFSFRGLEVDDRGNMYILDDKIDQIRMFDKEGRHLKTWGKKGQGPGEFQNISRMYLTPGGQLSFLDIGNNRLSLYSLGGKCLKETKMTKWRPFRVYLDSQGYGYGDILDFSDGVANTLLKFDENLNSIGTIANLKIDVKSSDNIIPMTFFMLSYKVTQDDCVIWASTGKYELNVVNSQGVTIRKILRDYKSRNYTKTEKDQAIKQRFGDRGVPPGAKLYFPPHHPIIYFFILDDEGRLYVRTYDKDEKGDVCYDVFDKDGRYFTRFFHPEDEMIVIIRDGKAYCAIQENEEGIPQVKRYAVIWE